MTDKLIENTQSYLRRAYNCWRECDAWALAGIWVELIDYVKKHLTETSENRVEISNKKYCKYCSDTWISWFDEWGYLCTNSFCNCEKWKDMEKKWKIKNWLD